MMFIGKAGLVIILLFVLGCATIGREFSTHKVSLIRLGETTQVDIRRMFGDPWRVGLENGKTTWTYGHYRYSLFSPAKTTDLIVRFNQQGVVESYSYNTTELEP